MIVGLSGGAGKTIVTLGLIRALVDAGKIVRPCKKGPDYIDAVWLGLAAGRSAVNLDPYLIPEKKLPALFKRAAEDVNICVVEGNRGLYDGMDVEGSCSSVTLARMLGIPVVLVLDGTKMTRTAAAIVHGVNSFEEGFSLAGVILNRTAGPRHRSMLQKTIERYTDVPLLGMLPKISPDPVPERHMGLVSNREYGEAEAVLKRLAEVVGGNCNLEALQKTAESALPLEASAGPLWLTKAPAGVRIGVVRDAALWFYYEENIEALRAAGAEIVEVSLLDDAPWPELHGLYMGGGFPETQAEPLSANATKRQYVEDLAESELPIYAECGGFMTLCRSLQVGETKHPMVGVFDVDVVVCDKPQGLGYVEAEVVRESPFHPAGAVIKGHEFHYSGCPTIGCCRSDFALKLSRGTGIAEGRDGLTHKKVFAGYFHLHALGAPWWAERFVAAAKAYKQGSNT